MTEHALFVAGKPITQGSKAPIPGRMVEVSGQHLATWRTRIGWTAKGARWQDHTISTGPVRIELRFVLPIVASAPRRYWAWSHRSGDLDKLVRAVGDALTGIAYRDDAQIVQLVASKHHGADPGVHITIAPIPTEEAPTT